MKTLKKVLSVALVLAMALSLVTLVGAANVSKYQDFTDADAIVNKEAVDTLAGLKVFDGLEDGSFGPDGYFTRAQAAAVIARMLLGRTVADGMVATTAPFADVPVTHWAAKYVQYCASRGIINGMGDNTFVPNGEVTAAQFAKMLLVAAGYGKKGEYVGADWAINAIVDAQNLGILDTNVDYMAPATRDLIARYAFNFYTKVAFVSYSKDIEDYVVKTVKINTEDVPQTLAVQQNVKASATVVINGVPSHKWLKNDLDLTGNYWPDGEIRVVYSYADGTALYNLTTRGQFGYKAPLDAGVAYFLNGEEITDDDDLAALKGKLGVVANSRGTLGLVVSLVDENRDGDIDMVLVIEKSVGTLAADPYVSPAGAVTIAGIGISGAPDDSVVGYQGLKKGDVVLYYTDNEGVTYIEKARTVSGQLTQGSSSAITFAGSVYRPSGLASAVNFETLVSRAANFNKDAMIWLDDGNGVIKFELTTTPPALPTGVLVGYRYDDFTGTAIAKIVKEDGTLATYSVAPNIYGVAPPEQKSDFEGLVNNTAPHGYLVSYAIDDQGRVTLDKVTDGGELGAKYEAKKSVVKIGGTNYYITNSTKVFYFDTTKPYNTTPGDDFNIVSVTTGYAATSEVANGKDVTYKAVPGTNVLSAIMFAAEGDVASTTDQYVFVTAYSTPSVTYDALGRATYHYNVYAGDELVTLKSANPELFYVLVDAGEDEEDTEDDVYEFTPGLYKITVNERGLVTDFKGTDEGTRIKTVNERTVFVTDGYVATDSKVVNTNANTKFFQYDASNFMAPVVSGAVEASSTYVHYIITQVLEDQYGVAQWVYYTQYVGELPPPSEGGE